MLRIFEVAVAAILVLCIFIVPASAVAALLGAAFGSIAGPEGRWWGACITGGVVAAGMAAFFTLDAMEG